MPSRLSTPTTHRRRLDKPVQIHRPLIPVVHVKALHQRQEEEPPVDKGLSSFLRTVDSGE